MNSSRNKILLFLVGILLLTNIAMLVFFLGKKGPDKQRAPRDRSSVVREHLKDSVGFTEQQLAQYDQLRQQNRENMKPLFEDLGNAKLEFYKYVNQSGPADSASQAAAAAIGEKQKALDLAFFNHFRQVRALCTPGQLPKYDSLVQHIIRRMVAPPHRGDHKEKKPGEEEKK